MGVRRRIVPLNREQLARVARLDEQLTPSPVADPGDDGCELAGWAEHTVAEWGHCGMLAEHEGEIIGYLTLVPAARVPHTGPFVATSFGADAAVLLGAHVVADWTRQGIGRQLVQAAAADLVGRRIAALETVGRPSDSLVDLGGGLPEAWLTAVGFRLVRAHPLAPRYRMSLSSTLRWRPNLSAAWHRIRGLVPQTVPPEPARFDRPAARVTGPSPDHRPVPTQIG